MNSMKYFNEIVMLSLFFFILACAESLHRCDQWLASKTDEPTINIAGQWFSPEWGIAILKQEGRAVSGIIGDYPVKGVVSGDTIYLLMYAGEKVDYTAKLEASGTNIFTGLYSAKHNIDEAIELEASNKALASEAAKSTNSFGQPTRNPNTGGVYTRPITLKHLQ